MSRIVRDVRPLPVHALESEGVNEIPAALATLLLEWLGLPIADSVVQSSTVGHTGASGFQRLANQALFVGEVDHGFSYRRHFEKWWRKTFGFGFDCLTRSEARYLEKSADAQAIRDRLIEAGLEGGSGAPESGSESITSSD
jgi:hypothetical protein